MRANFISASRKYCRLNATFSYTTEASSVRVFTPQNFEADGIETAYEYFPSPIKFVEHIRLHQEAKRNPEVQ